METLLYELLRKAASVELQRELFQPGSALSSYSVLPASATCPSRLCSSTVPDV